MAIKYRFELDQKIASFARHVPPWRLAISSWTQNPSRERVKQPETEEELTAARGHDQLSPVRNPRSSRRRVE